MIRLNQIYNMDCMKGMKQIPDKYFDLSLTDPPYGIDLDYNTYKDDNRVGKSFFEEMYRIISDDGMLIFTCSNKHLNDWIKNTEDAGWFYLHCAVYWNGMRAGGNWNGQFAYAWEPILFFNKTGKVRLKERMLSDVFKFTSKKETDHPAERDLVTWRRLISYFSPKLVIDPFIGSGTTAIVCEINNVSWVGFEIDKDCYEKAKKRIENHRTRPKGFFEENDMFNIQGEFFDKHNKR